jgi:hypothetical protein
MSKMVPDIDQVATKLLDLGLSARMMAPAWEGAGIRQPAMGPDGQFVGWMLPGKGLLLDGLDKDRVGITREIPYVYDYSPFARKRDFLMRRLRDLRRSEVGAITTYDGIIAARAGGKARDAAFSKSSITTVAAFWYDTFVCAGTGGTGVFLNTTAPTDAALNSASVGGFLSGTPTDPTGTDKSYLLTLGLSFGSAHTMAILIDRHIQGGQYRLSVDPAETTGTPDTVTRNYGGGAGVGAQLIATVTVARATPGAGTWTINYLDEGAAAGATVAQALAATADPVNRLVAPGGNTGLPFFPLASGDLGVTQIVSSDRATALDTTGGAAISIVQPLVWIPALNVASVYVERDLPSDLSGLVELANVSLATGCLGLLVLANAATLGSVLGFIRTCQG